MLLHEPVVPALKRQEWEEHHESKPNLSYTERSYLEKTRKEEAWKQAEKD